MIGYKKGNILKEYLYMAMTSNIFGMPKYKIKNKLKGIDIKKEYDLIKLKKSRLSRMMRDLVVYQHEKKNKSEVK